MLHALVYVGLLLAATVAGAINAVAGGGSLISFPALIWAGYERQDGERHQHRRALARDRRRLFGYREELLRQRTRVLALLPFAAAGGLLGSVVLLATPTSAFDAIVPFLILFACGLLAVQTPLSRFAQTHRLVSESTEHVPALLRFAVFVLAIYGGYFGAGLGIMMLAVLSVLLPDESSTQTRSRGCWR